MYARILDSRQFSVATLESCSMPHPTWCPIALLAASLCACAAPAPPRPPAERPIAVPIAPAAPPVAPDAPPDAASPPEVEIRGHQILLDGRLVGDAKSIAELGQLTKVDELFVQLEARRARESDRGAPAQGEIAVVADGSVAWIVIESVSRTAAFAGYPVALLRIGVGGLRFRTPVPGSPGEEASEPPWFEIAVDVRERDVEVSLFELTVAPPSASEGGGFVRTLVKREVVGPQRERASAALAELAEAACAKAPRTCLDRIGLRAVPGASFADVKEVVSTTLARARQWTERPPGSKPEILMLRALPREGRFTGPPGSPPSFRALSMEVSGRLPPEEIRNVVRARFGALRKCYEDGLRRDPNLAGRITVRFVIGRDGKVTAVAEDAPQPKSPPQSTASAPMPDRAVVSCVLREFEKFTFPAPEGGVVTVVYPIMFSPSS
ncbi:AgmX/PglI C-terminal domain-containing protein [Sorangium sp. So ce448]|uniref:AgmX/PglI C-terminal domain-containing protein n=1 Tax=Sorangium sp. So ce448 TaxID=3133314 RepID=UPI003F5E5604